MSFEEPRSPQTFVVPVGYTTVTVETWGAQGGGSNGGQGGYAKATVPVTPARKSRGAPPSWCG